MEMNVGNAKAKRISRQLSPVQVLIGQKQPEDLECFNYWGSMITNDARCTREIKSMVVIEKITFNKKRNLAQSNWTAI
jgi:hypothetical protein